MCTENDEWLLRPTAITEHAGQAFVGTTPKQRYSFGVVKG